MSTFTFVPNTWQTLQRLNPHRPSLKQFRFLQLDCLEAFYGGAAAGGKSQALLMAALQYIEVPSYSALILRRDTRRLELAGGLIPRSLEWLTDKGGKWNASKKQWTFPTHGEPSTLTFGYLQDSTDKFRYASSEYQFIGFDELTEFPEEDYLFLFSRLRKRRDMPVPLRVRSASNPGGEGHDWVKHRFIGDGDAKQCPEIQWRNGAAFIPAAIRDNPGISEQDYGKSLDYLPAVWRDRLLHGDWDATERGIVAPQHLRVLLAARSYSSASECRPSGDDVARRSGTGTVHDGRPRWHLFAFGERQGSQRLGDSDLGTIV